MNVAALHFGATVLNWYCPGCKRRHGVPVKQDSHGGVSWKFNGSVQTPTLEPSVLVFPREAFIDRDLEGDALNADSNRRTTPRCHVFIRQGRIEYLGDCTHELAGQTVDMIEWVPRPGDTE